MFQGMEDIALDKLSSAKMWLFEGNDCALRGFARHQGSQLEKSLVLASTSTRCCGALCLISGCEMVGVLWRFVSRFHRLLCESILQDWSSFQVAGFGTECATAKSLLGGASNMNNHWPLQKNTSLAFRHSDVFDIIFALTFVELLYLILSSLLRL